MKLTLIFLILLTVKIATASEGAEHGGHGEIPFEAIRNQAINLGILLAFLIFVLRAPLQNLFKAKKEEFLEESKKTEAALKQAEKDLAEAKTKLKELESNEATSLTKAEKEAEVLFNKTVDESKSQAQRIVNDTNLILNAEIEKAKKLIKEKLILSSTAEAELQIKNRAQEITKKSEAGFIKELEQVKA